MSTEALTAAVVAISFDVTIEQAREHVLAAQSAAAEFDLPIELLLGVEYVDSKFEVTP